ncbi:MAG: hypothetical protein AAFP70_07560 [Calditrichota bacterium]
MMRYLIFFCAFFYGVQTSAQVKTIHVFVALCDNENQGIVPVPEKLGNGKNPSQNLYWGALYGVKTYFKKARSDWQLIATLDTPNNSVLERILFKHKQKDVYLLADAWDGERIEDCTENFLKSSNGQLADTVVHNTSSLAFGGGADLLVYVGHNGLMDFMLELDYQEPPAKPRDAIILACYSKSYFEDYIRATGANPILWTTHLMAPEAYVLDAALKGWIKQESGAQIDERAAQAYNNYQKCGIRGARNLFKSGY